MRRTSRFMEPGRCGVSCTAKAQPLLVARWNVSWPPWVWKADGGAGNKRPLSLLIFRRGQRIWSKCGTCHLPDQLDFHEANDDIAMTP